MKKLLALSIATLALVSCTSPLGSQTPQDGDTVSVNYVGTLDDGSVFDSSRTEGRQPLSFVIGTQSMIPGFENAVKTLRVGDTKKFRIEAKDAYGEDYVEQIVPLSDYKESYVQNNIPLNALVGVMSQLVPLSQAQQLFGSQELAVDNEKTLGNAKIKITKIEAEEVTVSIDDPQAPFYGKTLEAGLATKTTDGADVKIISVEGDVASVEIKPNYEVVSKTDTDVTLRTKNTHQFANKPLNFEIELLSIQKNNTDSGQ